MRFSFKKTLATILSIAMILSAFVGVLTTSAADATVVGALTMEDVSVVLDDNNQFSAVADINLTAPASYVEVAYSLGTLPEGVALKSVSSDKGSVRIDDATGAIHASVEEEISALAITMTFDATAAVDFTLSVDKIAFASYNEADESIDISDTANVVVAEPVVEEKATAVIAMVNSGNVLAEYEYESLEEALGVAYELSTIKINNKFCDPSITLNKNVVLTADVEVAPYTTLNLGDYTVTTGNYAFEVTGDGKVVANYRVDYLKNNPLVTEAVSNGVYTYTNKVKLTLNSKSITPSDQIFINFSAKKSVSYTGAIEYGFDYYLSEQPDTTYTIAAEDFITNTSTALKIATNGIPAKDMANEVVGRYWAKATIDGVDCYAYSNTVEFSVQMYAEAMIGGTNAKLTKLLKDMLNYGTYFQIYKKYMLDDLANASLAESDKVLPTKAELQSSAAWIEPMAVSNLKNYSPASTYVKGKGLELLDVINIKYNLNRAPAADIDHVMCVWTKAEYEALTKDCTSEAEISAVLTTDNCNNILSKSEEGNFFVVEGIAAKKYADTIITRSMYVDANGKLQLDYLYSFSPIAYCIASINDSATGETGAVSDTCKALMIYAQSARDYFSYTVDAG